MRVFFQIEIEDVYFIGPVFTSYNSLDLPTSLENW